ncbi:aminodeoxychorismate/anthranilate synthase component II [Blattabacterium sp. (Cryptocercus kyebangensis)]|uniref:anthranilate synthase component II n=1 Tax=Blattabacterium sp. (Cryptocercus kyebangensis) TaxID=298656 RepID=UPI000D7D057A|nr:aminodeoxychorismate/anthranilate synthase component II [Blattabacterium sp. (Cryptocercus kyebangensis)]AWU43817.1 aminodeoxychorismate/anthranilate synthase component II [Blattabacterium sp. (Cryptocercus kyebangensis)]
MNKILILDNYDSFTYNLVHVVKKITKNPVKVYRNNEILLSDIDQYNKILLSPGPGIPDEAHILKPLVKKYASTKSIFGVCLGQQAIGEVFGATILNTKEVNHGIASLIKIVDSKEIIFKKIPKKIQGGRYHSWIISSKNFPFDELKITAVGDKGEIMALRHKTYDVCGVQFHPESILTPYGEKIIENWINKR